MKFGIGKGVPIEEEVIRKYHAVIPDELMEIWVNYGTANLLGGYLRVIDPEEYQKLLEETYFRGVNAVPIMATAFGDIITLEEGQYI